MMMILGLLLWMMGGVTSSKLVCVDYPGQTLVVPFGSAPTILTCTQNFVFAATNQPAAGQVIRQFLFPGDNHPNLALVSSQEATNAVGQVTYQFLLSGSMRGSFHFGLGFYTMFDFVDAGGHLATSDDFICDGVVRVDVA